MRKHLLSLLVLLLAGFGLARGQSNYDFYHVSGDDTLYFKYTSINTCKLVPPSLYNDWYGYTQPSGRVTIPDTVNYSCLVTEIAPSAFYGCTGITYLYVPPTIASIGESAFQGCNYLNEIYFDSSTSWTLSLDTIGPNAFAGCTRINWVFFCSTLEKWMNVGLGNAASNPMSSVNWSGVCLRGWWGNPLQRVDVPRSIHKIKKYTFYKWNAIREITMSDTLVTSIGDSAFFGIVHLDSLWIGHGVTRIGAGAFQGCSSLDFVRMGNSVSSIGEKAFQGCSSLAALTLPSITAVPNRLCYGCSHLHSIVIPNTVTSIGDYAFYNCSDMASLTLGNHVSSIGGYAFEGCGRLITITIPRSVTSIGQNAFRDCSFLSTVNFNADSCLMMSWASTLPVFAGCSRFTTLNFGSNVKTIPDYAFKSCTRLSSIIIPDSVVSIGAEAFSGCTGLTSLTIPNSVVTIGGSAFSGCTGLTTVYFNADSCVSMGSDYSRVFDGCTNITTVNIGSRVKRIPDYAFMGCSNLGTVTIPDSVKTIGQYAFSGCTGLTSITIPNSVVTIGRDAFSGCTGLTSLTIPNSVETIGQYAFSGCTGMSTLTIGKAVSSIGERAFQNCTGLNTVNFNADSCISMYSSFDRYRAFVGCTNISTLNIGSNVKRIPDYAFMDCSNIGSLTIPDSVKSIGQDAFSGCTGMSTLTIGKAVSSIGNNAFQNCTGLDTVNFNADRLLSNSSIFQGANISTLNIGSNVRRIPNYTFQNCSGLTETTIPDSVVTIGQYAFSGCTGMSTLTIGKTVSSIGNCAFQNCTGLATVNFNADSCISMCSSSNSSYRAFVGSTNISTLNIGNNVKRIPDYAFMDCSNIGSLTIPDSVKSIGQYAFSGCTGMSTLTIGKAVSSIGNYAFQNDTLIATVNFNADSLLTTGVFSGRTNITTLNIGSNVKRIPDYTFQNCSGLTDIAIPDSVKTIGQYAFNGCSGLTSLTIPNSVVTIGQYAFSGCTGLTSLTIPNSVETIGGSAFSGCTGMSTLTIGKAVSSIGSYAFQNDTLIATVIFNADSLLSTGVFSGLTNITTLNIGSNVKRIPSSTFSGCTGLTNITIPDSVKTIENYAFSGCTGMSTLTIGKAVSSIGNYAFQNCTGLDTVNFNADSLLTTGVFFGRTNITTLNIGSNVKRIPNSTFSGCTGLTNIAIPDSVKTIEDYAFRGCMGITSLTIPNSVVTIGIAAFEGCSGLTSLTIPNSVVTIGYMTFEGCSGLTSLTIPNSVVTIGHDAFSHCTGLTSLTIPNSVVTIGNGAFYGCTGLTTLTIPNSVNEIGIQAFDRTSLDTIIINNPIPPTLGTSAFSNRSQTKVFVPCHASAAYRADAEWRWFSQIYEQECRLYDFWAVAPSGDTLYYSIQNSNSVKVVRPFESGWGNATRPNGSLSIPPTVMNEGVTYNVTSIDDGAFYYCNSMTEVTIPNTMDSIGEGAFYYCSGLTTVNFNADSCIYAGSSDITAFYGCTNFSHLNIGSNVKRIPSYAFRGCTHLDTLTIPAAISTIGYNAFYGCTGLTTVNFNADSCTNAGYDPIEGMVSFVLGGCPNFTNLNIGDNVKILPSFAFWNCSGLQHVVVPNSVHSIGRMTFRGCTSLNTIEIGSGVSTIDDYAFYSCTNLLEIVSHNPVPPIVANNTFMSVPSYANVYVPCGSVPAYDSVWTYFTNIGDLRVVLSAVANDATMGSVQVLTPPSCSAAAVIEAVPNVGYSFAYWSDGDTSNPRTISMASGDSLSLVAYFVPNQYVLSVFSSNSAWGTVSGSGVYAYSTTATISATPEYGYHFTTWSDGVTDNPRSIIVTSDTMLTALFDRNQYILTAQCDSTQGSVAGAGTYLYEDTATVTATAAYGYHFTTWSDGMTDNPRTIIVTRDTMLTALFDRNQYTLTAQCDSTQGSVAGSGTYLYEDTAMVTATAAYGYHFTMWSDGMTDNPRTIIVTRDTMLTALFDRNQYTLTAQCDSTQGTVTGAGTYLYEDTATVTATAAYGYHFTMWNDGVTANPRSIIVTSDTMLTALFDRNQYTLTTQCDSTQGTVAGAGTYLYEDTATVTATAAYGYHFTMWSDSVTDNPRTIIVTSDTMLTALFNRNQYTVTAQCDSTQGTVAGAGTYLYEDTAIVTATAAYGYHFTMWSDSVMDNPRTIIVTRDTMLTAQFDRNEYVLTIVCDETQGVATGAGSYLFGDVARVTVTANEGFVFSHWAETGATEVAFDIVINGNVTLTALFDTLYHTLTLTSNNPEWGTVDGGGRYAHGSTATVTATAHEGFRFTGWSDGSEENPRTVVVNADLELMANFAEQTGIVDAEESNMTLFPNPTHGMLHIKADNVVSVEVCTIEGRVVMRASQTNSIDMSSLPTGVYYIRVESQQGRSVHKVVKQ